MADGSRSCISCGRILPEGETQCPFCSGATLDIGAGFPSLSGYRVLQLLGEGGMGAVYLAADETLNRRVAVKVVSERLSADRQARERFLREARSMATVEHPHIVRVYSFGEAGGRAYLVMEYVEGEALADRIRRLGNLPTDEALEVLREVVEALEAAWEKRIVHRDIKPTNILLDKRGRVHVADFGLAKPHEARGDATLSQTGYILGTPHYISPEQARGHAADFRSDIYSLGIVLYEMLSGERPFAGTTPLDVVDKQLHEALPPLKVKRPGLPKGVVRLVEWMTQKDPTARPDSYAQLAQAVESLQGRSPARPLPLEVAPGPSPRPRWLRWASAAALALAALAVVWFGWREIFAPSSTANQENRMVVAVAPFYGPDEDSAKEGRVMAALVEKEVAHRLETENAKVLGIEDTKEPVRNQDAARALGERLGASVVVWGEAYALRNETEIQPYFTMIAPHKSAAEEERQLGNSSFAQDPFAALQEKAPQALVVEAAAPNQIELRKTSAAGVGSMVLFLAGLHALYTEHNPQKALDLLSQAPKTAESLRYRAQALLDLRRTEQAIAALQQAVGLDSHDSQSYAQLGDLYMQTAPVPYSLQADQVKEAIAAYRAASQAGNPYTSERAIFYGGKLYVKETFQSEGLQGGHRQDTPYLLALDPQTGRVSERYRLPGAVRSFAVRGGGLRITCPVWTPERPENITLVLASAKFDRPIFYGGNLLLRWLSINAGEALAVNFMGQVNNQLKYPVANFALNTDRVYRDAPRTLGGLEAALRKAIDQDPTQPWYLFFLGQSLWAQGEKVQAAEAWRKIFAGGFSPTPYYEFAWMANFFERFGQRDWADRAYEEALRRRKQLPQPIDSASLIDRLTSARFITQAATASRRGDDLERDWLWFKRARELTGWCPDGDQFGAIAWAKYFAARGETEKARGEAGDAASARPSTFSPIAMLSRFDFAFYFLMAAMIAYCALLALLGTKAAKLSPRTPGARKLPSARQLAFDAAVAVTGSLLFWALVASLRGGSDWRLYVAFYLVPALAIAVLALRKIVLRQQSPYGLSSRQLIASFSPSARWALAVALGTVLIADTLFVRCAHQILVLHSMPIGFMDSAGHPNVFNPMEEKLKEVNAPETRYAVAVANHLAGNVSRARELYESLPDDARAKQNLAALLKGDLVPPVPLTAQDIYRGLLPGSWTDWLELWLTPGRVLTLVTGWHSPLLGASNFLLLVIQILGIGMLLAFWRIPSLARDDLPVPRSRLRKAASRAAFFLVPGAYDLRRNAPWRGYIAFLLFALCALILCIELSVLGWNPDECAFGPLTAESTRGLFKSTPFPTPSGLPNIDAVARYHFWTVFWAYPYIKAFLATLVLAASACLALHVSRLRRIWRLYT